MALIQFSLKHGHSASEAQARLRQTVAEMQRSAPVLVQTVKWSEDGTRVLLGGPGFEITASVDDQSVYVEGDIPLVAKLLGSPILANIKQVLQRNFQEKLEP
jgi:hypothetical protein